MKGGLSTWNVGLLFVIHLYFVIIVYRALQFYRAPQFCPSALYYQLFIFRPTYYLIYLSLFCCSVHLLFHNLSPCYHLYPTLGWYILFVLIAVWCLVKKGLLYIHTQYIDCWCYILFCIFIILFWFFFWFTDILVHVCSFLILSIIAFFYNPVSLGNAAKGKTTLILTHFKM